MKIYFNFNFLKKIQTNSSVKDNLNAVQLLNTGHGKYLLVIFIVGYKGVKEDLWWVDWVPGSRGQSSRQTKFLQMGNRAWGE